MFFKTCFLLGLVIFVLIRLFYQHFHNENVSFDQFANTKDELLTFAGLIIFGVVGPILAHNFTSQKYEVSQRFQIVGLIFLVISLVLFQKTHADLDKQFSHTLLIKKEHNLITSGTYSFVRHPMYSTALLMIASNALLMPNYASVASTVIAMTFLIKYRIPAEEKMLKQAFGAEFEEYQKNTKKIIPYIY